MVIQMKSKPRTVLRVKDGEFVLRLFPNRIETCSHIKDAMDVSGWDLATLNNVLNSLYNVGYKDMKVMVVKNG